MTLIKGHTKYQRFMPSSFTQENFLKFLPIWVYVKQVTPTTGLFLPQGYNVNNLGKGLQDKTSTK